MRLFLHRTTALFAALLFLGGASSEPWELHACEHHGGGQAEAESFGLHDHGDDGANHHADVHGAQDHGAENHESRDHGPCTCVGTCGATGGSSMAAAGTAAFSASATRIVADLAPASMEMRANPLSHLLPWANAPPV